MTGRRGAGGIPALLVLLALVFAGPPAFAADEPACGTKAKPAWCTSFTTGAVTVVTRGERREYGTLGGSLEGPLGAGLAAAFHVDVFGSQDGGSLSTTPQSYRTVKLELGIGGDVGPLRIRARSGATFSIEGRIGAPIDPRSLDALLDVELRLEESGYLKVFGGHDGGVGGWAVGADVNIPVKDGPALVARYEFPLQRDPTGRYPWVVTAGGRVRVKSFRIALPKS